MSNPSGAVPGTIPGIGYIPAFIKAAPIMVGLVYALLAGYLAAAGAARFWTQLGVIVMGSLLGYGIIAGLLWSAADDQTRVAIYGLLLVGMGVLGMLGAALGAWRRVLFVLGGMGLYLIGFSQIQHLTMLLTEWGRGLEGALPPKIVTNLAEEIDVCFRPALAMLGLAYAVLGASAVSVLREQWRPGYAIGLLALSFTLVFTQEPLVLIGTPYLIIAAYLSSAGHCLRRRFHRQG